MTHSHFGVYGIILNLDQTQILLIKKARGPYIGRYDLPGGSMESLELLEECLYREIKEETGCAVINASQIKAVSTLFHYNNGKKDCTLRHIGVIYRAEIEGTPSATGDGEDSNGCVWHDIKSIDPDKVSPFLLLALDCIEKK
ncbi:MAG: NUDIX domain-containing protein [Pseudomonadota bacterium]